MFADAIITLAAVWVGFALRGWSDRKKDDRSFTSHFDALGMEIRYCGQLAATYLEENIASPLYRLPNDAYRITLPTLFQAGLIKGDQANTLQKYYLQVEQVNRGLDNVDDFLRGKIVNNNEQGITLDLELNRLREKAREMRAQGGGHDAADLYTEAVVAFDAVFGAWMNRGLWRGFRRRYFRPMQHRIKLLFEHSKKLLARMKKDG